MLHFLQDSKRYNAIDDTTKKLYDYINQVKIDAKARERYMTWSEMVDYELEEAKEEARIEGRIEGIAEGDIKRLLNQIFRKINKGKTLEEIADDLEEEPEDIKVLYDIVSPLALALDFDVDRAYEEYVKQKEMILQ